MLPINNPDQYLPLFVYGTLRPGMHNHDSYLQGRIENIEAATISGIIHIVTPEKYPYLLPEKGTVFGELIYLKKSSFSDTIHSIDRLEDFDPDDPGGSLYLRDVCEAVVTGKKRRVEAWTYFWNGSPRCGKIISSGDFVKEIHTAVST